MSKKKILIAGGTGLIGQHIQSLLPKDEYQIHILSRSSREDHDNLKYFQWDVRKQTIDHEALKVDSIINLTGAGIADQRWTHDRKRIIIESRTESIKLLITGLKEIGHQVESIASASAIGYYGDRADETLSEESSPGEGFMGECCVLWEEAAKSFKEVCERLSILRVGIVLSTRGGALPKVLMTAPIRVLNYFGDGKQYYSWIHITDISRLFIEAITDSSFSGIYNGVAPIPLSNKEFVKEIADGLGGGYMVLPAPAFGLRLALGQMADVVLNSNRVVPERLEAQSYDWQFPDLVKAVQHLRGTKT
ncbi:MAG: TIGR01777 family protein [Saprospiraceae bacterium]|nr:TIGR01777 family protein [Saprospiraceae bacterium]